MRSSKTLILIFAVLCGAIIATHAAVQEKFPDGVTCTDHRIASYGYTHKQIALAEFAAISTWQREAEKKDPGFGQWHQAHRRSMKCRVYKNSAHFQCIVSARPCRYKSS